jgi:hypothetical protein
MSVDAETGMNLFWELAEVFLAQPTVSKGTMMGYPCLRNSGAFFACVERTTGHLVVKLSTARIIELVASGLAIPFAPNGRTFREWATLPVPDRIKWVAVLDEARSFTSS